MTVRLHSVTSDRTLHSRGFTGKEEMLALITGNLKAFQGLLSSATQFFRFSLLPSFMGALTSVCSPGPQAVTTVFSLGQKAHHFLSLRARKPFPGDSLISHQLELGPSLLLNWQKAPDIPELGICQHGHMEEGEHLSQI